MNNITIEYDLYRLTKDERVKVKGMPGRRIRKVEVKNPKAWMVSTIENSTDYTPGEYLNKKQVDALCRANKFNVVISAKKKDRY
tara:strand:- start:660 stop:911 length:252 start_codon:yes stop_codon:yes gene_type:complete